jgi:hypothetical protein
VVLLRVRAGVLDIGWGSNEVLRGRSGVELHDGERRGRERRERAWDREREELGWGFTERGRGE